MIRSYRELRADSRSALLGNYGTVFLATLISSAIVLVVDSLLSPASTQTFLGVFLYSVSTFAVYTIGTMLKAGQYFMSLNIARRGKTNIADLFLSFRYEPLKAVLIAVLISLIESLCTLPIILTVNSLLLYGAISVVGTSVAFTSVGGIVAALLIAFAITLVLETIVAFMYSQALFLYIDHQEYSAIDCLRESRLLMRGQKLRLLGLKLSFIGYFLLVILTFGLGIIWVQPYLQVSQANFYMDLTGNYHPY